jgi:hypothetical protein
VAGGIGDRAGADAGEGKVGCDCAAVRGGVDDRDGDGGAGDGRVAGICGVKLAAGRTPAGALADAPAGAGAAAGADA